MQNNELIAVASKTFSTTPELANGLKEYFGNIQFNFDKKLEGDDLVAFIGDAKGAIIALETVDEYVLERCKNLEIISKYGVGLDSIDLEACKRHGVKIGWTGGVNKLSAAEMTIGFMLGLSRNLFKSSYKLKRGVWDKNGGLNLSGRTIGIIGVGNIGKEVIRLLKPFGCKILVNDIIDQREYYAEMGVTEVSKEELYAQADIISLHVPLTSSTERMINAETIALMRSGTYVINAARGPLVEYGALKEALQSNKLAGVATDVYEQEPPEDAELIGLDNLVCTPHIGGNSKEAVIAMGMSAIDHLKVHFLP